MYKFSELLILFTVTLFLVVLFSFINEKTIKLPYEIGLVVFGFAFCLILLLLQSLEVTLVPEEFLKLINQFDFNDFLIHGILCFMLFSGASSIKFNDFNEDKALIGRMAILGTLIAIAVYGVLFYGLGLLFHFNLSLLESLILGAIVAPSDPISAMSILGNVGLPHRLSLILEGESLFNDGIAVAVFATLMTIQAEAKAAFLPGSFIGGLLLDIAAGTTIMIKTTSPLRRNATVPGSSRTLMAKTLATVAFFTYPITTAVPLKKWGFFTMPKPPIITIVPISTIIWAVSQPGAMVIKVPGEPISLRLQVPRNWLRSRPMRPLPTPVLK